MLGQPRRTTRVDVGLALAFCGIGYLVWAAVAGVTRQTVQDLFRHAALEQFDMPAAVGWLRTLFADMGILIDLVGLALLALSLLLVGLASRQKVSVAWPMVVAVVQAGTAGVGATVVNAAAWQAYKPYLNKQLGTAEVSNFTRVSEVSWPIIVLVAVVLWAGILYWLIRDRHRWRKMLKRGPTLRDGLRTNVNIAKR